MAFLKVRHQDIGQCRDDGSEDFRRPVFGRESLHRLSWARKPPRGGVQLSTPNGQRGAGQKEKRT
jgi:hypothetical protein